MKAPQNEGKAGSKFIIPDGVYPAVCIMVIDCGMHEKRWGEETKMRRDIYLRFELPGLLIPDGDYEGQPACQHIRETWSMYKKANLRGYVEGWRGKRFTDAEADDFDIDTLAGKPCTLQIALKDDGFTEVMNVMPYSGPDLEHLSDIYIFDTEKPGNYSDLPEWVQKKINLISPDSQELGHEYADVQGRQYAQEQDATHRTQSMNDSSQDFEDDIPF